MTHHVYFLLSLFLSMTSYYGYGNERSSSNKLKLYTVEEFLNAPDEELTTYKKRLDQLIQQKKLNIPQSQAQLFYPDPILNKNNLHKNLSINLSIIDEVPYLLKKNVLLDQGVHKALANALASENKANARGDIALYHSTQPKYYAKNYINTELQKLVHELQGQPISDTKMLLLRDTSERTDYEKETKKRKQYVSEGVRHDWKHTAYLLSCNLGITGNIKKPGESAISYFLKKFNVNPISIPTIPCMANRDLTRHVQGLDTELESAVEKFDDNTKTGVLLQLILKNKKLAKKTLYSSYPYGVKKIGNKEFQNPVTLIKRMRTNPRAFGGPEKIGTQQMRAVLTADKLLDITNPKVNQNFEVHAYSGNEDALNEFHNKVGDIVNTVRTNYVSEYKSLTLPQKLGRFIGNIPHRTISPWHLKQDVKRRANISNPFM